MDPGYGDELERSRPHNPRRPPPPFDPSYGSDHGFDDSYPPHPPPPPALGSAEFEAEEYRPQARFEGEHRHGGDEEGGRRRGRPERGFEDDYPPPLPPDYGHEASFDGDAHRHGEDGRRRRSEHGFEDNYPPPPPPRPAEFEPEYRHEVSFEDEHRHGGDGRRRPEHGSEDNRPLPPPPRPGGFRSEYRHEASSEGEHRHGEDGRRRDEVGFEGEHRPAGYEFERRRQETKGEEDDDEEERGGFRPDYPPASQQSSSQDVGNSEKIPSSQHDTTSESEPTESSDQGSGSATLADPLPQGRLVRIFCKENPGFNLAVERNIVAMRESNPEDEAQQWIKDASYGVRIKDKHGYPAFRLVNKKTRKFLKPAREKEQQVLLVDYQQDINDDSILWSESQDFGEGFKTLRSASDTLLNLTVFEGQKKIRNGSALVLDTWHKKNHQLWQLSPL